MSDSRSPADVLLDVLIALLAPLFLTAANNDLAFARLAAAATIDDYRVQTRTDLINIAQIVAFGLTALASLSQSMEQTISLPLALRLRGSANSCRRSADQTRRALKENQPEPTPAPPPPRQPEPMPPPDTAELASKIIETEKRTAEHLASYAEPTVQDSHAQAAWAAGMARIAAETVADLESLPPQERHSARIWAEALNACANDLMNNEPLPRMQPGDLAGFMRSTTL